MVSCYITKGNSCTLKLQDVNPNKDHRSYGDPGVVMGLPGAVVCCSDQLLDFVKFWLLCYFCHVSVLHFHGCSTGWQMPQYLQQQLIASTLWSGARKAKTTIYGDIWWQGLAGVHSGIFFLPLCKQILTLLDVRLLVCTSSADEYIKMEHHTTGVYRAVYLAITMCLVGTL